jgi:hypothetical protein
MIFLLYAYPNRELNFSENHKKHKNLTAVLF